MNSAESGAAGEGAAGDRPAPHAPTSTPRRSRALLSRTDSRLLIVDVQEKLLAVIPDAACVVENCRRLLEAARLLAVPREATEQYPKGLGPTVAPLAALLGPCPEKLEFSACGSLPWIGGAPEDRPRQVVVAGLETHVCILQTTLNLIAAGCDVFLPVDALASRKTLDHDVALRRMADAGATLTTTESVLFEWCERAGTPEFKQISRLVTGR